MDFQMNDEDQNIAFDTITTRIAGTANWRRSLVVHYPEDTRNGPAAARLDELAQADAREVLPSTWAHLDFESPRFSQVLNDTARDVGFRRKPKNIDHFVTMMADRIADRQWGAK